MGKVYLRDRLIDIYNKLSDEPLEATDDRLSEIITKIEEAVEEDDKETT